MDKDKLVLDKTIDEKRQGEVYEVKDNSSEATKSFFIESYGCAMNFSDSEIVASILSEEGYRSTKDYLEADLILVNTCSIRENAEQRVRNRLKEFKAVKENKKGALIGVLGCMAERLKAKMLEEEKLVDLVVGPDAYRDLPNLINTAESGQKAVNVFLSREETYADISPVRLGQNGVTAFVSIMRGCDNMCTFCVVPYTRGRERSRNPESIINEIRELRDNGYRDITLLGQNVDSYNWKEEDETIVNFAQLLEMTAQVDDQVRIRFSTSHPKDITDDVMYAIAKYENVCNYIHLPAQSGSSRILEMMNRGYTRSWYLDKIKRIREIIPDCGISSDIITGFCSETEEDHQQTLSIIQEAAFDFSYMFSYSERPNTAAQKKFEDDVPTEVKSRRLSEIVALQGEYSLKSNEKDVGKIFKVLIEGVSKKSDKQLYGRNSQNKVIVFPKENLQPGQYVQVKVNACTRATLLGEIAH